MPPATVLVIEDLEYVRDVVADLLGLEAYRVLTASSVQEVEAVRERLGLGGLDLVITNLRLTRRPEAREGADLIQRWHAVEPRLPFILMSGDLSPHDMVDLPSERVWYLAKPFATEVSSPPSKRPSVGDTKSHLHDLTARDRGFHDPRAEPHGARGCEYAVALCARAAGSPAGSAAAAVVALFVIA
jgi:CheY-like chemotaxis protein